MTKKTRQMGFKYPHDVLIPEDIRGQVEIKPVMECELEVFQVHVRGVLVATMMSPQGAITRARHYIQKLNKLS